MSAPYTSSCHERAEPSAAGAEPCKGQLVPHLQHFLPALLIFLLPLVGLDLLGDYLGCSRQGTLGMCSEGFPLSVPRRGSDPPSQAEQSCPSSPRGEVQRGAAPGDRDPAVTSSLMSVSTAAFSDSLRQMPARGLSLLLTLGHLSMEHSPGLSWGELPSWDVVGGFFSPTSPVWSVLPYFITETKLWGRLSPVAQVLIPDWILTLSLPLGGPAA